MNKSVVEEKIFDAEERADFIVNTYLHLFGAILLFVFIEYALFSSGLGDQIAKALLSVNWLIVLGAFILVAWLASHTAHTVTSISIQYFALFGYVVAEAIIFCPLLYLANKYAPGTIDNAATVTISSFIVLTIIVYRTRKNFSFLRPFLVWGGWIALMLIVMSVLHGWTLGVWFIIAMIAYAGAAILYDTSNILFEYKPGYHVAASLELFASVALLFWYVVQLYWDRD